MPAQTVLLGCPLPYEALTMVHEQTQVPLDPIESGDRQVRLAQGRSGDSERVDGVALAGLAATAAGASHELGRHAHDGLTRGEKVSLEATRQLATVLECPASLTEALGPAHQREVSSGGGRDGPFGEPTTVLVDGHDGMAALVQIGSDDHHIPCLLPLREGGR